MKRSPRSRPRNGIIPIASHSLALPRRTLQGSNEEQHRQKPCVKSCSNVCHAVLHFETETVLGCTKTRLKQCSYHFSLLPLPSDMCPQCLCSGLWTYLNAVGTQVRSGRRSFARNTKSSAREQHLPGCLAENLCLMAGLDLCKAYIQ